MKLENRLKMLIAYKETSVAEVAKTVGLSVADFHKKMKTDGFTLAELKALAAALGASLDYAFDCDGMTF